MSDLAKTRPDGRPSVGARPPAIWSEFQRYFLVGGFAFLVDSAVLIGLVEWAGSHYLTGATAGFVIGALINYWLSVHWVFSERALSSKPIELGVFVAIGVGGLGLNDVLMWLFTDVAGLHYLGSKVVAAALVFIYNFVLRRALLFTSRRAKGMPACDNADERLP